MANQINNDPSAELELAQEEILFEVTVADREQYKRLDHFLAEKISGHSRTFIKNLHSNDQINLDESSPDQNIKLELKKMPPAGTKFCVSIPPPLPATALPEDEHLVVINKPAGLVTHPAPGNYTGTLVNAILYHCKDLQGVGDQKRPGIVHRLDKGTSGVMVVAKTQATHEGLVLLFSTHNIERYYEGIIMSLRSDSHGTIESIIGRDPNNRLKMKSGVTHGKRAVTHYKLLEQFAHHAHMEFKLETGRTHQIRVHAAEVLRRPLVCDPIYGNPHDQLVRLGGPIQEYLKDYPYPLLHAKVLGFVHPITKEKLHFEVPPPKIFKETLDLSRSLKSSAK